MVKFGVRTYMFIRRFNNGQRIIYFLPYGHSRKDIKFIVDVPDDMPPERIKKILQQNMGVRFCDV